MVRFLWIMPMPPSLAMAIASEDSVTVSIAELSSGILSVMRREILVSRDTDEGRIFDCWGTNSTSSKV